VPLARKGVQSEASPDRAFQLDLFAGRVKAAQRLCLPCRAGLLLVGRP
jgi:hypothetical protein